MGGKIKSSGGTKSVEGNDEAQGSRSLPFKAGGFFTKPLFFTCVKRIRFSK